MRSLWMLGAIQWINENRPRARQLGLAQKDIDKDFGQDEEGQVVAFCKTVGISAKELVARGKQANAWGCLQKVGEKQYDMGGGEQKISVLRSIKKGWDRVDGTHVRSDADTRDRYDSFPTWQNNSCAIDVTLFTAIMLEAGRCQVDQITANELNQLTGPAIALRLAVCTPWGTISASKRDQLRDFLADALEKHDPIKFTRGGFLSISEVFETCFDRLPQASFTATRAIIDCEGFADITSSTRHTRRSIIHTTDPATVLLETSISNYFGPKPLQEKSLCSALCLPEKHYAQLVILDRLPPTFIINLAIGANKAAAMAMGLFDSRTITSRVPGELTESFIYDMVGYVMHVNKNHFKAHWVRGSGGVEYDGMISNKITMLEKSWKTDIPKNGSIVIAVFRRQE